MPAKTPLTADELLNLRNRLDEIDSGIIDLIAERQHNWGHHNWGP